MNNIYLRNNSYICLDDLNFKEIKKDLALNVDAGSYDISSLYYRLEDTREQIVEKVKDGKIIVPKEFVKPGLLKVYLFIKRHGKIAKYWHVEILIYENFVDYDEYVKALNDKLENALRRIEKLEKWKAKKEEIIL